MAGISSCSKNTSETTAKELTFTYENFTRVDSGSNKEIHSFDIPQGWQSIYDNNSFSGQEAFFNKEKTKYVLLGFENKDILPKLGLENLKTENDFKTAIKKLKELWEKNEFLTQANSKYGSKPIGNSKNIKAYVSEIEAVIDLSKASEDFKNFQDGNKQLIYIMFMNYDDKYIGYYAMIDSKFDQKSDLDIINSFINTLKIYSISN